MVGCSVAGKLGEIGEIGDEIGDRRDVIFVSEFLSLSSLHRREAQPGAAPYGSQGAGVDFLSVEGWALSPARLIAL